MLSVKVRPGIETKPSKNPPKKAGSALECRDAFVCCCFMIFRPGLRCPLFFLRLIVFVIKSLVF